MAMGELLIIKPNELVSYHYFREMCNFAAFAKKVRKLQIVATALQTIKKDEVENLAEQ